MVVAYLMTVTQYRWDECLSAVKAVRSFVGPNYGFQQQLQEYQTTQLSEVNAHTRTRPVLSRPLSEHCFLDFSCSLLVICWKGSEVPNSPPATWFHEYISNESTILQYHLMFNVLGAPRKDI